MLDIKATSKHIYKITARTRVPISDERTDRCTPDQALEKYCEVGGSAGPKSRAVSMWSSLYATIEMTFNTQVERIFLRESADEIQRDKS